MIVYIKGEFLIIMNYIDYAFIFKALSDQTRLEIVELLKNGSLCACKILEKFSITQPTLSYHMKTLVDCGLVNVEKVGIWNHYSLNNEVLLCVKTFL